MKLQAAAAAVVHQGCRWHSSYVLLLMLSLSRPSSLALPAADWTAGVKTAVV
jgi:hypothetical protein